jgi:hypothetical protein
VVKPQQVTALGSTVASLRAGFGIACAVDNAGSLWCWGDDNFGEIDGLSGGVALPGAVALASAPACK